MAIDLPDYTADELDQRAMAMIRAQQFNTLGVRDADVRPGSDYYIWARLLRSIALMFQSTASSSLRALDPRQAFGSFIRQYADNAAIGTTLKDTAYQAQYATGKAMLIATSGGDVVGGGALLAHGDGTRFSTSGAVIPGFSSKTFTVGYRSTRRKIYMGRIYASALDNEVYENLDTPGYIALLEASVLGATPWRWVQMYIPLDADPVAEETYARAYASVIDLTASATGTRGNKAAGDRLELATPVGFVTHAQVLYLTGGRDALSPSQVQQAMRNLYGTRMEMVTLEEIRRLALDTPDTDVREVYVFPSYLQTSGGPSGAGQFDVYPMGTERCAVSQADCNAITTRLRDYCALTDSLTAIKTTHYFADYAADWTVTMKVSPEFAPDWMPSDLTTSFSATGTHGLSRVKFTGGVLPDGLNVVAGNRVILSIARGVSYDEDPCIVVRRIDAVGADYLDLTEDMPYVPTRSLVSQGGPFAADLIAATESFFDGQAPYTTMHRHPHPDAPTGLEAFQGVVAEVAGVVDVVVDGSATPLDEFKVYWPKSMQFRVWA